MDLKSIILSELAKKDISPKSTDKSSLNRIIKQFRRICLELMPDTYTGLKLKNQLAGLGYIGTNCALRNGFQYHYGTNIYLMDNVFLNYNCLLLDSDMIMLGNNVRLGPNVNIYTIDHKVSENNLTPIRNPVFIEDGVWIGGHSTILPNVRICKNSIIAAGSVVTKSVEPNSLYAGVPAKKIKTLH